MAAEAGADFVGCVLVPGSKRAVTSSEARAVGEAAGLPLVLVVADLPTDELVAALKESGAAIVQLHGSESPADVARLRAMGSWGIWKGVRTPSVEVAADAMDRFGGIVDGLLLDGFDPAALGGTGVAFPWEEVAPLRERLPASVLFVAAGGLNPANAARAVSVLRPDVVDVSSGVEVAPGIKDPGLIRDFVSQVRSPFPPKS